MRKLLVLCLLVLTGCYTYAPARGAPFARGMAVRAQLSTPMDFRLTELTANNVVSVTGEVVRQESDTVVISAQWLRAQSGYQFPAAGETITIPADHLADLERRRISPIRSAAIVAAGAVAGVLFVAVFEGGGGGGGTGRNPPKPQ